MTLTAQALRDALSERGAILDGHFRLSSGRHSARFIQKFRILESPPLVAEVAASIIAQLCLFEPPVRPTMVVSAAVGGIVLGYECARGLGTLGIFVEKENGIARFRRGFSIQPQDRVLVVEDVVTTGLSVREIFAVVQAAGATISAVAIVVRRAPFDLGVPTVVLLDLPIESYEPDACPQCAAGVAIDEPGSRFLSRATRHPK